MSDSACNRNFDRTRVLPLILRQTLTLLFTLVIVTIHHAVAVDILHDHRAASQLPIFSSAVVEYI